MTTGTTGTRERPVKTITTQEASIKTATVEVKTLTLGGKQMTLSVFRQLQEEELIDMETGQFRGLPWGTVNYHPDCRTGAEHLHVVWQKGSALRRATVYRWLDAQWIYFGQPGVRSGLIEQREWGQRYQELLALDQLFIAV